MTLHGDTHTENGEFIAEEKLDKLMEQWKPALDEGIKEIIHVKYSGHPDISNRKLNEELPEFMEREVAFCKRVIRLYDQWSKEENTLVLWDIDETIGMSYRNAEKNGQYEWQFRPGFKMLAKYISENYPNVTNGFLTTAGEEYMQKIGDTTEPSSFFSMENRYAVPRLNISAHTRDAIESRVKALTGENSLTLSEGETMKMEILFKLMEQGKNIKNIDDGESAFVMGANGLNVKNLIPTV